jgi:hypothetical protein
MTRLHFDEHAVPEHLIPVIFHQLYLPLSLVIFCCHPAVHQILFELVLRTWLALAIIIVSILV